MSKKEEKKPEEGKAAEAKKEKGPPDEIAETRKKRKLVLFAGITGVVASAAAAGGFFVYKTFVQKSVSMAAKKDATGHSDSATDKNDAHAEGKEKSDGDKKTDAAHADKNDAAHANKKDDKKDAAHSDKKDDKKDSSSTDKKDEKSDVKMFKSDETFGETFALPKMDLNLGNPLENRYLRIAVSIEYTGGKEQQDELKKREPQLRDLIISSVSTRTRLDLLTEKGKEKLRRELINKINESFERPVKTIYFTDFLVE